MKKILIASAALAALAYAGSASAALFPAIGADSQPGTIITYAANGSVGSVATGQGPYDRIEDSYIGVTNNSKKTQFTLNLTSSQNIGGFDGDGISNSFYGAPGNIFDTSQYGGPDIFFTNNLGTSLTVNFIGGLAPGASTYFSLEEKVAPNSLGVPEPATWAMMLMGFFGMGALVRRQRSATATA